MQKLLQLQQIVPSKTCLSCDVCCRFLDLDSSLAPIFTRTEFHQTIRDGADADVFQQMEDGQSARVKLKPHGAAYICPFFETDTSECIIYPSRPLDCRIYPFALMYNADGVEVVLGVDSICPFAEVEFQAASFQRYINHMTSYLESKPVTEEIAEHWSLIGPYQENVTIVAVLQTLTHALAADKLHREK